MIKLMRNTIKNHNDFKTDRAYPYAPTGLFTIRTRPCKFPGDARYGLVVTKRNFRFAVQRNRVKRLLRDWIAFAENYMCDDMDYVFYAHPEILGDDVNRDMGREKMVAALRNIKYRYEKKQSK